MDSIRKRIPAEWAAIIDECKKMGVSPNSVRVSAKGELSYSFKQNKEDLLSYEDIRDETIKEMKKHAPKYPKIKHKKVKGGHLLLVDLSEPHFNKVTSALDGAKPYNLEIAKQRILDGVRAILNKSSHLNIDQILLIGGNDFIHTEGSTKKTSKGTPQDMDKKWHEAYQVAKKVLIEVIEMLLPIAKLHVMFNRSNHDEDTGYMLMDSIYSWFNYTNITWDVDMKDRKYFKYHNTLIGSCHNDTAKTKDLGALMANDCKFWSECEYRYIFGHHTHHKESKDHIGWTMETVRSVSESDAWHLKSGYTGVHAALEGFVFTQNLGQDHRFTNHFE